MPTTKIVSMLAATTVVASLIAAQAPAQAAPRVPFPLAPACQQWRLNDNALVLDLDNGVVILVGWDQATQKAVSQGTELTSPDGGKWYAEGGRATFGGLAGPDGLDFGIEWETRLPDFITKHAGSSHLVGKIEPEFGGARGTLTNERNETNEWVANEHFTCAKQAEEPKPQADPQPQVEPQTPAANSVTVLKKSDVYDAPEGNRFGPPTYFLAVGRTLTLAAPCSGDWCQLNIPDEEVPGGKGFVYAGEGFLKLP